MAVLLFGKFFFSLFRFFIYLFFYFSASGTEDAVRVYAEAATRAETDDLAFKVAQLVYDRAGGVGARP